MTSIASSFEPMPPYAPGADYARVADAADPLAGLRDRFLLPADVADGSPTIYLCGNSLGLQPRRVAALLASTLAHGSITLDEEGVVALLDRGCADAAEGRLGLDDAVRLAMVLGVGEIRDQAYVHMLTVGAQRHRVLWGSVCRQVHAEIAAAPLALAALAAYLGGAGTLATAAIERARVIDAEHASVSLVNDILRAGIPPGVVRDALTRSVLDDR